MDEELNNEEVTTEVDLVDCDGNGGSGSGIGAGIAGGLIVLAGAGIAKGIKHLWAKHKEHASDRKEEKYYKVNRRSDDYEDDE